MEETTISSNTSSLLRFLGYLHYEQASVLADSGVTVCHIVVCVVMWYEFELMVRFDSVREMLPTRQHSAQ